MKDSLAERLKNIESPPASAAARLAARRAALDEFARVQAANTVAPPVSTQASQGFWSWLRLSRDDTRNGSSRMKLVVSRTLFGGVASFCVVAFAAAILWPMFRNDAALQSMRPPGETETADRSREWHYRDAAAASSSIPDEPEPTPMSASPAPRDFAGAPAAGEFERACRWMKMVVSGNRTGAGQSFEASPQAIGQIESITRGGHRRPSGEGVEERSGPRWPARPVPLARGSNRLPLAGRRSPRRSSKRKATTSSSTSRSIRSGSVSDRARSRRSRWMWTPRRTVSRAA